MPVYYSKFEEEQPVFHVFLGCGEGSKIAVEDRVEKVKKRSICRECLVLMKQATWVQPRDEDCDHGHTVDSQREHREIGSATGS